MACADDRPLKIERMTVEEVAQITGMSPETIKAGLRDGVFPWGYAIQGAGGRWVYWINKRKFYQIEMLEVEAV